MGEHDESDRAVDDVDEDATLDAEEDDNLDAADGGDREGDHEDHDEDHDHDHEEHDAIDQMQELVAYVAKQLVDEGDAVEVEAVEGDRAVVFELTVAQGDLGKVIGRDGRTARAIRTLLSATSAKLRKRAVLEILE